MIKSFYTIEGNLYGTWKQLYVHDFFKSKKLEFNSYKQAKEYINSNMNNFEHYDEFRILKSTVKNFYKKIK